MVHRLLSKQNEKLFSMLIYWNHAAQELCLTFHNLQRRQSERDTDRRHFGTTGKDIEHKNEGEKTTKRSVPLRLPPNVSNAKSII